MRKEVKVKIFSALDKASSRMVRKEKSDIEVTRLCIYLYKEDSGNLIPWAALREEEVV